MELTPEQLEAERNAIAYIKDLTVESVTKKLANVMCDLDLLVNHTQEQRLRRRLRKAYRALEPIQVMLILNAHEVDAARDAERMAREAD